jgi:DNA invertase Pin-like site-specific DNA recombinase
MKVALYARVSKDEAFNDERFQNPENQLQPLREFCKAMQWEVIAEYVDRMSGASSARPQFRQMLQDAMLRRFSGIVTWKLDRFSREGVINTMAYIKQLKERGIWLKSMTEGWLDTSQEGVTEMVLAVMAWAAAEERKKISERTKAGIARRRAIGQWRGGRPKKKPLPSNNISEQIVTPPEAPTFDAGVQNENGDASDGRGKTP